MGAHESYMALLPAYAQPTGATAPVYAFMGSKGPAVPAFPYDRWNDASSQTSAGLQLDMQPGRIARDLTNGQFLCSPIAAVEPLVAESKQAVGRGRSARDLIAELSLCPRTAEVEPRL
mmetsp:Transcript_11607/g.24037  ORF Transcript_11607/g.24037 Transcript_11607/m.24037 type:complete len:118 (+) Transcript_11607:68-421(+)